MRLDDQSLFHIQVTESCESRDSPSHPKKKAYFWNSASWPPGILSGIYSLLEILGMTLEFSQPEASLCIYCLPRLPGRTEPSAFRHVDGKIKGQRWSCVLMGNFQMETRSLSEYVIIRLHFIIQLVHFILSKQLDSLKFIYVCLF